MTLAPTILAGQKLFPMIYNQNTIPYMMWGGVKLLYKNYSVYDLKIFVW